jgi:cyclophilin family peptidyl-prolyl cis-trans isomerase
LQKSIFIITICLLAIISLTGCDTTTSENNKGATMSASTSPVGLQFPGQLPDDQIQNKKAIITTAKGTIEIELWADKAPLSVSNFIYLADHNFYNGLTFHRVEPGFVAQGGDPTGNGTGGPGYQFPDEPVQGEYKEGTVAMANSGPDTNGSQFFIDLADNSQNLAKSYNLFGQVTKGMDVIKKIAVGDKMTSVTIENIK